MLYNNAFRVRHSVRDSIHVRYLKSDIIILHLLIHFEQTIDTFSNMKKEILNLEYHSYAILKFLLYYLTSINVIMFYLLIL